MGIEPGGNRIVIVPLFRHKVETTHGRASIDEASDAHAVVEVMPFAPDKMNFAGWVTPTNMICRRDTGNAVTHNHHLFHRFVIGEAGDNTGGKFLGLLCF